MILPRYSVYRVIADVRYAGMWFRSDGSDLYVIGDTTRLTADLQSKVKCQKLAIIDAVNQLPPDCRLPTVCLNVGCREACQVAKEWSAT